jgi:hypothetical protein
MAELVFLECERFQRAARQVAGGFEALGEFIGYMVVPRPRQSSAESVEHHHKASSLTLFGEWGRVIWEVP